MGLLVPQVDHCGFNYVKGKSYLTDFKMCLYWICSKTHSFLTQFFVHFDLSLQIRLKSWTNNENVLDKYSTGAHTQILSTIVKRSASMDPARCGKRRKVPFNWRLALWPGYDKHLLPEDLIRTGSDRYLQLEMEPSSHRESTSSKKIPLVTTSL